jgi:addiction module RelE/StbE family toxin
MKLIFDDRAISDLENIHHWIAQENPKAARAVVDRIVASVELLASFPHMGRPGRDEGTREWVVPRLPYIVIYEVSEKHDDVIVIAVFHGAQDWPERVKERRNSIE